MTKWQEEVVNVTYTRRDSTFLWGFVIGGLGGLAMSLLITAFGLKLLGA